MGINLSYTDQDGQTLLNDGDVLRDIFIFGHESRKGIKYKLKTLNGNPYLDFNADFQDAHRLNFKQTTDSGETELIASTEISVKIMRQEIKLKCTFRYHVAAKEFLGNSSIVLRQIEYKGKVIEKKAGNDIVLDFMDSKDGPVLLNR